MQFNQFQSVKLILLLVMSILNICGVLYRAFIVLQL